MHKVPDLPCEKCGSEHTRIEWKPSSGMDIQPTGMFRICTRCGYEQKISSLDEKVDAKNPEFIGNKENV